MPDSNDDVVEQPEVDQVVDLTDGGRWGRTDDSATEPHTDDGARWGIRRRRRPLRGSR
ncbi:MAG: hypothetical protein ACR2QE_11925 [Acidimicrobiales bacterium]